MSTGAVTPFTPNGATQNAAPVATANSLLQFQPCDAFLFYNSGSVVVTVGMATAINLYGTTPVVAGGVPIPPGQELLLGAPGVVGVESDPIVQVALLSATGTAGTIYVTPGLGTQH